MLHVIKNYRKLFILLLQNNINTPSNAVEDIKKEDFKDWEFGYLKTLKRAINDWELDSEEIKVISESIDEIELEAKKGLGEIIKDIFENWIKFDLIVLMLMILLGIL